MRFGEGLCLPSHAALTSTGAQGFRPGKGRRGSEGGGRTRNVAVWLGVGRMLRPGRCLDLKSHLVLSLSPDPEGGGQGQVAEAGGMSSTSKMENQDWLTEPPTKPQPRITMVIVDEAGTPMFFLQSSVPKE